MADLLATSTEFRSKSYTLKKFLFQISPLPHRNTLKNAWLSSRRNLSSILRHPAQENFSVFTPSFTPTESSLKFVTIPFLTIRLSCMNDRYFFSQLTFYGHSFPDIELLRNSRLPVPLFFRLLTFSIMLVPQIKRPMFFFLFYQYCTAERALKKKKIKKISSL